MTTQVREKSAGERPSRGHDPVKTKDEILEAATKVFAEKGLNGARVDEIAAATHTSKRMIYYYFDSKEGLYEAVLGRAYRGIRRIEQDVVDADLSPTDALLAIIRETFDYQADHPNFARLVAIENIQRARFLKEVGEIQQHNRPIIESLGKLIERGVSSGVFRPGLDPVGLHWLISAGAVFNVSNDATFSFLFEAGQSTEGKRAAHRKILEEAVMRYCLAD